jgi:sulfoxide reductase heme-binding subunit YedZ
MTPLRLLFGVSWPISLRRLLGLFAFFYVCMHFAVWIVVDHFFDWEQMLADIVKRPYITVGVLALTLLVPLAATSTARMVKRLGGANWRRLHRLVYLVGVLAVLHYLWLAKVGVNDPYVYAGVLALLLGIRLWDWARRVATRRRQGVRTSRGMGAVARSHLAEGGERSFPIPTETHPPGASRPSSSGGFSPR